MDFEMYESMFKGNGSQIVTDIRNKPRLDVTGSGVTRYTLWVSWTGLYGIDCTRDWCKWGHGDRDTGGDPG